MADVQWALLCGGTSVDKDTNNLSVFNIVDELTIEGDLPTVTDAELSDPKRPLDLMPMPLILVTLWRRSPTDVPEDVDVRIQLKGPAKTVATTSRPSKVSLREHLRTRHILRMQMIPYLGIGDYAFLIERKVNEAWQSAGTVPLIVKHKAKD